MQYQQSASLPQHAAFDLLSTPEARWDHLSALAVIGPDRELVRIEDHHGTCPFVPSKRDP
jgi:hypothetical protein